MFGRYFYMDNTININIYIYIERERDRERQREGEIESVCVCKIYLSYISQRERLKSRYD